MRTYLNAGWFSFLDENPCEGTVYYIKQFGLVQIVNVHSNPKTPFKLICITSGNRLHHKEFQTELDAHEYVMATYPNAIMLPERLEIEIPIEIDEN